MPAMPAMPRRGGALPISTCNAAAPLAPFGRPALALHAVALHGAGRPWRLFTRSAASSANMCQRQRGDTCLVKVPPPRPAPPRGPPRRFRTFAFTNTACRPPGRTLGARRKAREHARPKCPSHCWFLSEQVDIAGAGEVPNVAYFSINFCSTCTYARPSHPKQGSYTGSYRVLLPATRLGMVTLGYPCASRCWPRGLYGSPRPYSEAVHPRSTRRATTPRRRPGATPQGHATGPRQSLPGLESDCYDEPLGATGPPAQRAVKPVKPSRLALPEAGLHWPPPLCLKCANRRKFEFRRARR